MSDFQPRIQISGDADQMTRYCQAVQMGGCVPVPGYCPAPDPGCAGLILCGGGDMDPAWFGQENRGSHPPDALRDKAEMELFQAFYRAKKPILGICRGMQLISIALGGDLIQDLPPEQALFHGGARFVVHPIRAAEGSLLHRLYGPAFPVNSYHHQAVDRLGRDLIPTAWSESGILEAFEHRSLPILGVQFHPERMAYEKRREDTVDGAPLLNHFLSLCRDLPG